jgi:hypothetical protein
LIEESDQVFPNQVIEDYSGGKRQRRVRVVNLHHTEIDETVPGGLEKTQGAREKESRRREEERQ